MSSSALQPRDLDLALERFELRIARDEFGFPLLRQRNGLNMPVVGPLPPACAATCSASANVQMMGTEAAVTGDVTLLKQAMLHDPLVGAVCNPEEVWQMTDEMLAAQAK